MSRALATEWLEECEAEPRIELAPAKAIMAPPESKEGKAKTPKGWMTRVEREVAEDTSLSIGARHTYTVLCGMEGVNGEAPFPGLPTLAKKLDCIRETVQGYIKELVKAGLVEVVHRRKNGQFLSNEYRLLRPSAGIHRSGKNRLRKTPLLRNTNIRKRDVIHGPGGNSVTPRPVVTLTSAA